MVRNLLALGAVFVPIALFACGGSSTSTTGTAGTGGTTAGSTSGTGGVTTDATGTSTGTATASTGTTGTGGVPATDQCKNAADGAILAANDLTSISTNCATSELVSGGLKEPDLTNCIAELGNGPDAGTQLSTGCAGCFSATVHCTLQTCGSKCNPFMGGNPNGAECTACRMTNCDPAFFACSGLPMPSPDGGTDGG